MAGVALINVKQKDGRNTRMSESEFNSHDIITVSYFAGCFISGYQRTTGDSHVISDELIQSLVFTYR